MNNLERWRIFTDHLPSPDIWIDFSWLFTVSAALQRRVWYGSLDFHPLFSNLFLIFCGPPATGKTLCTDSVRSIVTAHEYNPPNVSRAMLEVYKSEMPDGKMYLFPISPKDITYAAMCRALAQNTRAHIYTAEDGKERIYSHSSMVIMLSELKSLFKRHESQLPNLTLELYDCEDYDYVTKHEGSDVIKNTCGSIIAGCVPKFLDDAQKFGIFDDGWISRTIWSFEMHPRFEIFFLPPLRPDQIEQQVILTQYVKSLSTLYGPIHIPENIKADLEEWARSKHAAAAKSASKLLQPYYGRKKVHIIKLAMAYHFSDSHDMCLCQHDFDRAMALIERTEKNMRWGFSLGGRNQLQGTKADIVKYIRNFQRASMAELLAQYGQDISLTELRDILEELQIQQIITRNGEGYEYVNRDGTK